MHILLTLVIGIIGWKIAAWMKLPAPAMLGSMITVGLWNITFDVAYLPTFVKIFAQAISGAFIGMQISKKDVLNFKYLVKPFLFLMILLTLNTFVVGMIIHVLCKIDITTSLLSCVAGGVTDISLIAMDMGADAGLVALMQTSRLVFVLLFFSYWIQFVTKKETDTESDKRMNSITNENVIILDKSISTRYSKIWFTIITSFLLGYLGYLSKIPAATMVIPMTAIVLLNCTTSICLVPNSIKNIAQLLAGSLVGVSIRASTFANIQTTVVPILILLVSYWGINIFYSLLCKKWKWLDLKSAMFASAPGGATDMSLIAADLNADLTKIALIQVFRAAYVVAVMPFLISLFVQLSNT